MEQSNRVSQLQFLGSQNHRLHIGYFDDSDHQTKVDPHPQTSCSSCGASLFFWQRGKSQVWLDGLEIWE